MAVKEKTISKDELARAELSKHIRQVKTFAWLKGLFYTKQVNFSREAESADKAKGLKPVFEMSTQHPYGPNGSFRPTIAEIVTRIPKEHLENVVAFEWLSCPSDDPEGWLKKTNGGYHLASVRFYAQG